MRRAFRLAFALVFAGTLASCRSTTEPRGSFSASATASGVRLSNDGSATVFYMMVDPGMLALLDFIPCTSRSVGCKAVEAHSSVDAPRSEIIGNRVDLKEAVVYFWVVREGMTGDRLEGQGSLTVPLQ